MTFNLNIQLEQAMNEVERLKAKVERYVYEQEQNKYLVIGLAAFTGATVAGVTLLFLCRK